MKLRIFIPQLVNYLRKFKREEIYFELVKVDCFPFLYFEDTHTHTHTHTHTIYIYIYIYMSRAGLVTELTPLNAQNVGGFGGKRV